MGGSLRLSFAYATPKLQNCVFWLQMPLILLKFRFRVECLEFRVSFEVERSKYKVAYGLDVFLNASEVNIQFMQMLQQRTQRRAFGHLFYGFASSVTIKC